MSALEQANEFLASGGVPPAKFEDTGTTITGTIVHAERQQQREIDTGKPKFWDDGSPREQIVVQLDTTLRDPEIPDDDGRRSLYVRGNMLKALRVAVKRAGSKLEIGGELTVTYTGNGEQVKRGFNPPKLYTVEYVPPAPAAMATVNDILGAPAPAPVIRPPGIPADQWDALPETARAVLAEQLPKF